MTQVAARDLAIGDRLTTHHGRRPLGSVGAYLAQQGVISWTRTSYGVTYVWLDGRTNKDGACNVVMSHGDPCVVQRSEDLPSRWDIVGPDDADLVDVYDCAETRPGHRWLALTALSRDERVDLIEKLKGTV